MCVIIHKPAGVDFSEDSIRSAAARNRDGFGVMYFDKKENKIVAYKGLIKDVDKVIQAFKAMKDEEACFHFRLKTHGAIAEDQAHPFRVTDNIYFMHNGIISGMPSSVDESDTQAFNRLILQPILSKNPELLESDAFRKLVEGFIGTGNKLTFMGPEGKVIIFNKSQGDTFQQCWVSNKYSFNSNNQVTTTNWNRGTNTTVDTNGFDLVGDPVEVGDKVLVWGTGHNFSTEGKITALERYAATINFIDEDGVELNMRFSTADGSSWGAYPNYNKYQAMASRVPTANVTKLKKKDSVESTSNTLPKAELPTDNIKYKDIEVDLSFCWGYTDMDFDSRWDYGGVSVDEFATMTQEERLQFFVDNQEAAFCMLSDLVEVAMDYEDEMEGKKNEKQQG